MAEVKIVSKGFRCERCGHEWIPRLKEIPTVCPNSSCHSAYWNKPRRGKK